VRTAATIYERAYGSALVLRNDDDDIGGIITIMYDALHVIIMRNLRFDFGSARTKDGVYPI